MKSVFQIPSATAIMMPILATFLLLAGCSALPGQRQVMPTSTYLLQMPENAVLTQTVDTDLCLTLLVTPPRAAPGFTSSRIAYMQKDYQLDYFAHHQWADPPAHMLASIFTLALESSRLFRAVVAAPAPITADLRLDTELLRLQQNFEDDGSKVQLQLRAVLFDQKQERVVATRIFSVFEPAPEDTPYGAVVAANQALASLLSELSEFIGKSIQEYRPRCQGGDHVESFSIVQ